MSSRRRAGPLLGLLELRLVVHWSGSVGEDAAIALDTNPVDERILGNHGNGLRLCTCPQHRRRCGVIFAVGIALVEWPGCSGTLAHTGCSGTPHPGVKQVAP